MIEETKIPIELSQKEAALFIEFQKRYAFMKLLETIGAFSLRNSSLTIHFDSIGAITKVEKHEYYKP